MTTGAEGAMAGPHDPRGRRSVRLFLIHLLIAIAFMVAFVWVQAHR